MQRTLLPAAICALALGGCATLTEGNVEEARRALAPSGKLRVALFEGNPTHAVKRPSGETVGVAHDVGRTLADRLGVGFEPVAYTALAKMLDAGRAGEWDVAFLGVNPERRTFLDFTSDYIGIEIGYLVPGGSPVMSLAQVDRPGIRVAVVEKGSPEALLRPILGNARLVAAPSLAAAIDMVRTGEADVLAGQKPVVLGAVPRLPGSRVLDGTPASEMAALAIPKGRDASAISYATRFVDRARSDGTVRNAIERAGLRGVQVAGPP